MPTLSKPELIERESPWQNESDRFYQELWLSKVPILKALGFYEERNLQPEVDQPTGVVLEEETEIKAIAGVVTVAACASGVLPRAGLIATLKRICREPNLFRSGQLPEEVECEIARNYQRGDENAGTHWQDIWSGKLQFPEGQVEVPTDANIARAADAAIRGQGAGKRGRTPNLANQVLAQGLGEIFRRSGQRIVRRRVPIDGPDKTAQFIEDGPFYDFLRLVLPPLQAYLREQNFAPVTIDTIVRLATEGFLITQ